MKRILFVLSLLFVGYSTFAQTLTVSAPSVVSTDETFRVEFTANGNVSDFKWEPGSDFSIVWGPQKGSSHSFSNINGKRESTHTETYTYLLQPTKEGKFTISGATATVEKTPCNTGDFVIEVVAADPQQQRGSSSNSQGGSNAATTGTVDNSDLYLSLSLSKLNVVKGEPITATLVLYTRADIAGFEDVKFPTFNGFWSKETYTPNQIEFTRENIDGKIYNAAVLRRYMLIPQQEGIITIDPAEMLCQVRVRAASNGPRSIFDEFFDNYQVIRKRITTQTVNVHVKNLPAGAPASFAGGVGDFKISASFSKDSLSANEAVSLNVKISGTGNISMLEVPKIAFPNDFEVYDVKTSESISDNGTTGSKSFEFPIIPRSYGNYVIGPIEYSYYNINANRYVTVSTPELILNVEPGTESATGGLLIPGAVRQSVRTIDEDIRFINVGNPNLTDKNKFLVSSPIFYIIVVLLVIMFFVILNVVKNIEKQRADLVGTRNKKANKLARARLKIAENYLNQNLTTAFYDELHKAFLGYLADKLAIPAAELSKDNISNNLQNSFITDNLISDVTSILDECEFARYSPDLTSEKMHNLFTKAINVISQLEGLLNNKKKVKNGTILISILLLLISGSVNAQILSLVSQTTEEQHVEESSVQIIYDDLDAAWEQANLLYSNGKYQDAINQYLAIVDAGKVSAPLYYNIANSYYRLGYLSNSILYYERALKVDPSYIDAQENLKIAHSSVLDNIESVPDFILITWITIIKNSLTSNSWAVITLILLFVLVGLLLMFRLMPTIKARKTSFVLACVVFVLSVFTFSFALSVKKDALSEDSAIVMMPVSSIKSSPDANSKSLFILHEGTKINILDELGSWIKIELSDGRQGWMPINDVEII